MGLENSSFLQMDSNGASNVPEIWKQGAEARLYQSTYLGKPCIIKERFKKKYRHPDLEDLLSKDRIRNEAKSLVRCRLAGVHAPTVYHVDIRERKIIMELIQDSCTSKEFMLELIACDKVGQLTDLASAFGSTIGKLHQIDIIHGDLTTSNILVRRLGENEFVLSLVDFGLSYNDQSAEDKAVDLYVLERAIVSTIPSANDLSDVIVAAYVKENKKDGKLVIAKLLDVRLRGRKRLMIG